MTNLGGSGGEGGKKGTKKILWGGERTRMPLKGKGGSKEKVNGENKPRGTVGRKPKKVCPLLFDDLSPKWKKEKPAQK